MMYTLLVYDRGRGQLVHDQAFSSRVAALEARFRVERELSATDGDQVEVVVLTSASRDDLMRTHSRYFRSLADLARDAQ